MGQVNGQLDLELVGPVDTLHADASLIYTGDAATGMFYDVTTNSVTRFPAYDGYETAEAIFHFLAYALLLFFIIGIVSRILTNKNPTL